MKQNNAAASVALIGFLVAPLAYQGEALAERIEGKISDNDRVLVAEAPIQSIKQINVSDTARANTRFGVLSIVTTDGDTTLSLNGKKIKTEENAYLKIDGYFQAGEYDVIVLGGHSAGNGFLYGWRYLFQVGPGRPNLSAQAFIDNNEIMADNSEISVNGIVEKGMSTRLVWRNGRADKQQAQIDANEPASGKDCEQLYKSYTTYCDGRGVEALPRLQQQMISYMSEDPRIKISEFNAICGRQGKVNRTKFSQQVCGYVKDASAQFADPGLLERLVNNMSNAAVLEEMTGTWCKPVNNLSPDWIKVEKTNSDHVIVITSNNETTAAQIRRDHNHCVDFSQPVQYGDAKEPAYVKQYNVRINAMCLGEGQRKLVGNKVHWSSIFVGLTMDEGPDYNRCGDANPVAANPSPNVAQKSIPTGSTDNSSIPISVSSSPVGRLQIALTSLGIYHGSVNGTMDDLTKQALKSFRAVVPPEIKRQYGDQIAAMAEAAARHEFSLSQ